jgi:GWxTD domain-containing protein
MTIPPRLRRRLPWPAPLALALLVACGGGPDPATLPTPSADQTLTEIFNLPAVYTRMGRLAAGMPVPFVGTVAFLGGRGDSSIAQIGLSLPNRSLSFSRDGQAFAARFRAEITLERTGQPPLSHTRDETVRVRAFDETQRSDESILFQQGFLVEPGEYTVTVELRDLGANASSRAQRTVTVPAFGPGTATGPILAYATDLRQSRSDSLPLLLNPRGTVSHGVLDTLLIYVEGYRFASPVTVPVEVRDDRGAIVYLDSIRFQGGREVESRTLRMSSTTPPLGELTVAVPLPGGETRTEQVLVSFSRGWVVTNYDNLLSLLRFFPYPSWVARLRDANATERSALWREFWVATDPTPETAENEALDLYFTRVAIANERWRDEGANAWRSDRGEVFVTLGQPDIINTNNPGAERALEQWVYNELRGTLYFEGQLGFSRMRLMPESRSEFSRMRALVQRR